MKKESMQIKFEGQNHQVDSNTLINILLHYNTIISEANKEFGGGSRSVQVRINALEKGSFVINIELVENIMESIFSVNSVAYLSGLVTVVGGVFNAYKHYKGAPIKEDHSVVIDGDLHINSTIINVYNQPMMREAISKSIETASEDASVEGITISGNNIDNIEYTKDDFPSLIYTDFDSENLEQNLIPEEQKTEVEALLSIIKLSFESGSKWLFLYEGFKIQTIVKDDALMRHIDAGAKFAKGDSICVRMEITRRYNQAYRAYENKSYKILEFIKHIQRPEEKKLF